MSRVVAWASRTYDETRKTVKTGVLAGLVFAAVLSGGQYAVQETGNRMQDYLSRNELRISRDYGTVGYDAAANVGVPATRIAEGALAIYLAFIAAESVYRDRRK